MVSSLNQATIIVEVHQCQGMLSSVMYMAVLGKLLGAGYQIAAFEELQTT